MRGARRLAIVTGGSRGIGLATAEALLRDGYEVAICARDERRLREAETRLAKLGKVHALRCDVRDAGAVRDFVQALGAGERPIAVVVNNAGVAWWGGFADQPTAAIDEVIDTNLKGALYVTREVLPHLRGRNDGVIVNVASGAGRVGFPELASYCSSKFGLVGFTESLAQELAPSGVRVYAVCPGRVDTDLQRRYAGRPLGIAPARVADTIARLVRDRPQRFLGRCVEIGEI